MIWTKEFWKGAGERAIKTFFQTFVALIGTTAVIVQEVDWALVLSGSALAAVLSIATSLGNAQFTSGDSTPESTTEVFPGTQDFR